MDLILAALYFNFNRMYLCIRLFMSRYRSLSGTSLVPARSSRGKPGSTSAALHNPALSYEDRATVRCLSARLDIFRIGRFPLCKLGVQDPPGLQLILLLVRLTMFWNDLNLMPAGLLLPRPRPQPPRLLMLSAPFPFHSEKT